MEIDPSITTADESVHDSGPSAQQPDPLHDGVFQHQPLPAIPGIPDFQCMFLRGLCRLSVAHCSVAPPQKDPIRELCVKVHIRRSGRDSWNYLGRAFVTQEFIGHTSRVGTSSSSKVVCLWFHSYNINYKVVRSAASGKIMVIFSEVVLFA